MFSRINPNVSTISSNNNGDDIIFAIVTNNFKKVKELVNRTNVNKCIDLTNKYTALHYAVTLPNHDITQYILDMGASPDIKQNEGYNSYELALRSGKKYIFEYFKEKQDNQISTLQFDNTKLIDKVDTLKQSNDYLNRSIDDFSKKVVVFTKTIEDRNKTIEDKTNDNIRLRQSNVTLDKALTSANYNLEQKTRECTVLKRDLDDTQKAFSNLLKRQKK